MKPRKKTVRKPKSSQRAAPPRLTKKMIDAALEALKGYVKETPKSPRKAVPTRLTKKMIDAALEAIEGCLKENPKMARRVTASRRKD